MPLPAACRLAVPPDPPLQRPVCEERHEKQSCFERFCMEWMQASSLATVSLTAGHASLATFEAPWPSVLALLGVVRHAIPGIGALLYISSAARTGKEYDIT